MATKKKMLQAAAGNAGGAGLNVEDVFSTYLYTGNGSTQTITNGIDLAGEGGLVWAKGRVTAGTHNAIMDTERGTGFWLATNLTGGNYSTSNSITSFNSDGFTLGADGSGNFNYYVGEPYASWTFRKAPKFFDVQTWTGNGTAGREIAHNLGTTVGTIIVKKTNDVGSWAVFHRSITGTGAVYLDLTSSIITSDAFWNNTNPTETVFTVGSSAVVNRSGDTYVAYLFAHNDGDGDFGPDGDLDIIKCGSYTGNGSTVDNPVTLGWEPQWLLIKQINASGNNWVLFDTMRGIVTGGDEATIFPNISGAEGSVNRLSLTPTGFSLNSLGSDTNANGSTYIYIAIRRGTKVPESGTEVFAQDFLRSAEANAAGVQYYSGWPVDMSLFSGSRSSGGNHDVRSRLTGDKRMFSNATDAETSAGTPWWDTNEGWKTDSGGSLNTDALTWMWKRAPGYFDVVAYTGNSNGSTPTQTLTHNLGVKPEMMWVKSRGSSQNWYVFHKDVWDATNNYYLRLNSTAPASASDGSIFPSDVTDTQFTVSERWEVNQTGVDYIAYLFATLPGVSKVGSYTGNGTSQTIDCGFTTGARFILIKRTDTSGFNWYVFDTARGIVSGLDPALTINDTEPEVTIWDMVDPDSSGFSVTSDGKVNASGGTFIFYAIA